MWAESFLFSAVFLLTVITISIAFSKKLGLGTILGLLVAGVVVGPHSPGPVLTNDVEAVRHFTEFGVVLLLFLIGLEMQPKKLWSMRRDVFGMGFAQIIVSGIFIAIYTSFYTSSWKSALIIGLTYALSSTAFVVQILQERGAMSTKYGKASFSILLMQDLAIVPLLAFVPILADSGTLSRDHSVLTQVGIALGMIGVVILLGRYIIPKLLERFAKDRNQEAFIFLTILSVLLSAWTMEQAGLSMALGAFLMGMMLSESKFHLQIQAYIEPYKGLLMSLFFVAVGMSLDLDAVISEPTIIFQHLIMIMGIKIIVLLFLVRLFGYSKSISIKVAFLLSQSGEFGFVLFGVAKSLGVVSDSMFVVAITIISVSMALTPLVIKIGDRLAQKYEGEDNSKYSNNIDIPQKPEVIIAGYGRVGHIVGSMLNLSSIDFIAYDTDVERVKLGRREGRSVLYGDMSDYRLLSSIDLSNVKLIVVTVDSHFGASKVISHIKNSHPEIAIYARSKDAKAKEILLHYGANWVLPEAIEGSLRLGAEVLFKLGKDNVEIESLLGSLRVDDYNGIKILHDK